MAGSLLPLLSVSILIYVNSVSCQTPSAFQILGKNVALNAQPRLQIRTPGSSGPPGVPGPSKRGGRPTESDQEHRDILTAARPEVQALSLQNLETQAFALAIEEDDIADMPSPDVRISTNSNRDENCPFNMDIECDSEAPYRTADATCNNLENPINGMAKTPMARLVRPQYDDGVSSPRRVFFKSPGTMPSPRKISTTVHLTTSVPSTVNTHALMTFSQFVDHDLTLTPEDGAEEGEGSLPLCCAENFAPIGAPQILLDTIQRQLDERPECFPIEIPEDDRIFNGRCMNFVRSAPTPNAECTPDARQQLDDLTHFIDGSMIYGSSKTQSDLLREENGGLLRSQTIRGEELLPDRPGSPRSCRRNNAAPSCSFDAGDRRSSENAALTSQHSIWLRYHNSLAKQLYKLNPTWDDEKLFQETRKIVVGILQHIIYKEWLPVIIGDSLVDQWAVRPQETGFFNAYEPALDVSVLNVFSAAAFRFGHTLIRDSFSRRDSSGTSVGTSDLSTVFDAVSLVNTHGADVLARGLIGDNAEAFDRFCARNIRDNLFNGQLDLFSLNINRGRDHGLGSYNDFRRVMRLDVFDDFPSLDNTHNEDAIDALQQVYPDVEDIEIWPGALSERHVEDGLVGPTFGAIIGLQFFKIRFADRFWYEREDPITGFTEDQLTEIRRISLASLICSSTNVDGVQAEPFKVVSPQNPKVSCEQINQLDLSPWKQ